MKIFTCGLVVTVVMTFVSAPVFAQAQTVTFTQSQITSVVALLDQIKNILLSPQKPSKPTSSVPAVAIHCSVGNGSQHGLTGDDKKLYFINVDGIVTLNRDTCKSEAKKVKGFQGNSLVYVNGSFYSIEDVITKYDSSFKKVSEFSFKTGGDSELSGMAIQGVTYDPLTKRLKFITNGANDGVYSVSLTGGDVEREMNSPFIASYGIADSQKYLFISGEKLLMINKTTGEQTTINTDRLGSNFYITSLHFDEQNQTLYGLENNTDKIFSVYIE